MNELTRFQKDIENDAVQHTQKLLEVTREQRRLKQKLGELYDACPWVDPLCVAERAQKRVDEDEKARSGRVRI